MEELLQADSFHRYQRLLINIVAKYVESRLFSKSENDIRELIGAIELGNKIISAPKKIRDNDYTKKMIEENIKRFELKFIRGNI